jgi:hypothetical protein
MSIEIFIAGKLLEDCPSAYSYKAYYPIGIARDYEIKDGIINTGLAFGSVKDATDMFPIFSRAIQQFMEDLEDFKVAKNTKITIKIHDKVIFKKIREINSVKILLQRYKNTDFVLISTEENKEALDMLDDWINDKLKWKNHALMY